MSEFSSRPRRTLSIVLTALGSVLAIAAGVVLLVAEKTTAGAASIGIALLLILPLGRLPRRLSFLRWVRVALVLALLVLVVVSISGTDLPPDSEVTGIRFVDQVLTIWDDFVGKVSGA